MLRFHRRTEWRRAGLALVLPYVLASAFITFLHTDVWLVGRSPLFALGKHAVSTPVAPPADSNTPCPACTLQRSAARVQTQTWVGPAIAVVPVVSVRHDGLVPDGPTRHPSALRGPPATNRLG